MKAFTVLFVFLCTATSFGQNRHDARLIGTCEGCEAVFEYGDKTLTPVDTLPGFVSTEPQLMITGTVFMPDGVTPAEGVVLYIYHTDRSGRYASRPNDTGWAKRHGYHRGWVKTGKDGRYTFYTIRPASYPNTQNPQHIHPIVLEPNGTYYWLGSYFFDDDPFITDRERYPEDPRGGSSGVLTLTQDNGMFVGHRDIVLGRNVPGY